MEKVKVATTFLGLWDTSQPTFCKERGEFARAGLDVEITTTRGGSENVQAVIAGGMDIGYSPGLNSVLAAYAQGNKIKIISSEFLGQNDTYFYVPADSPIKSIADLQGKSVAFPRPGGASEAILLGLRDETKMNFKMVATGGMDATYTMTMTKQVDVGYAIPPSMLSQVQDGKIRVLFSGDDVAALKDVTGRVNIASTDFIQKRGAVAKKFLEVLDGCIEWSYRNLTEAAEMYAKLNKVDAAIAAKGLAFYKRSTLNFGPIKGFEVTLKQALDSKFIDKPLTPGQIKDLVDILYTSKD
jgi:NitT/TauT family transport system substrate-binding protein